MKCCFVSLNYVIVNILWIKCYVMYLVLFKFCIFKKCFVFDGVLKFVGIWNRIIRVGIK